MTGFKKSLVLGLAGAMVATLAVSLPLVPAFGEGGARRDVLLHEAKINAATMATLYLVEFETTPTGTTTSRAQQIERIDKLIIPTLESLGKDGKVRAGGITVDTHAGVFVVEAKSEDEVTELLRALPAQSIMQWKVTQLETFAHRADIERKTVQGLRTQK
jgi:Muconolactone delta-isomerase